MGSKNKPHYTLKILSEYDQGIPSPAPAGTATDHCPTILRPKLRPLARCRLV